MADLEEDAPPRQPCDPLRISYKDPVGGRVLTEDVFLDPRDSWREDGSLLLVDARAVTGLQKQLDKEAARFREARQTLASCQRDYLRERQFLVEEIGKIARTAHDHQLRKAAQEVVDEALSALKEPLGADDATEEEVALLSEQIGTRESADEPLVEYLRKAGINCDDEFAVRILLKLMRDGIAALELKRDRLQQRLDTLESRNMSSENVAQTLLEAVYHDGATMLDLILALIEQADDSRQQQILEDLVTGGIRLKYDDAQYKFNELKTATREWKSKLKEFDETKEQQRALEEDVEALQRRVAEQEAAAEAAAEARAREQAEKAEALEQRAMKGFLSKHDKAELRLDEDEMQYYHREEMKAVRRSEKVREEVLARQEARSARRAACEEIQGKVDELHQEVEEAEAEVREMKAEAQGQQERHGGLEERLEQLQDLQEAAKAPPLKKINFKGVEQELEEASRVYEELQEEEAVCISRERLYEERFERATAQWEEIQAEEASAEGPGDGTESAAARRGSGRTTAWRADDDPDLLEYYERVKLGQRAPFLHTQARARARELRRQLEGLRPRDAGALPQEHSLLSATTMDTDGLGRPSEQLTGGPSLQLFDMGVDGGLEHPGLLASREAPLRAHKAPVSFRHLEDLKHRLAYTQYAGREISGTLHHHRSQSEALAEELRALAARLGQGDPGDVGAGAAGAAAPSGGAQLGRLRAAAELPAPAEVAPACARLRGALAEAGEQGAVASELRAELLVALDRHQASEEKAHNAWSMAVRGCEMGAGEWELALEEERCAACGEEAREHGQALRAEAVMAAAGGPAAMIGPTRRFVAELDAARAGSRAAVAARAAAWGEALRVAGELGRARAAAQSLGVVARAEAARSSLLRRELAAPPEAQRALAAVREAGPPVPAAAVSPRTRSGRAEPAQLRRQTLEPGPGGLEAEASPGRPAPVAKQVAPSPRWHRGCARPSCSRSPEPLRRTSPARASAGAAL